MAETKSSSNSSEGKSGNTRQISPAKHWFLTHNNYTKECITLLCSNSSIKRYVFQEKIRRDIRYHRSKVRHDN